MSNTIPSGISGRCGVVSISIDVGPALGTDTNAKSVFVELIDRFNEHGLPATWAFSEPADETFARRIDSGSIAHEISLLGDKSISHSNCSRAEFTHNLVKRLQKSLAAALPISTVALAQPWPPRYQDMLVKYGVRVIRSPRIASRRFHSTGLESVCYSLWHMPIAATFAGGGWMANHAQSRLAQKVMVRAISSGGFSHLTIDVPSIVRGDAKSSLRTIDRVLVELSEIRSMGQIEVEALRDTAIRLQPRRTAAGARSILRAA